MIAHRTISGFLSVTSVTSLYFPELRMVSASVTLLPCDRLKIPSKSLFSEPLLPMLPIQVRSERECA